MRYVGHDDCRSDILARVRSSIHPSPTTAHFAASPIAPVLYYSSTSLNMGVFTDYF